MTLEIRSLVEPPEFRSTDGKLVAAGVAMRYGAMSKPIAGQFREVFNAGAFTKTIREQDVRSHNEHDGPYLARTGAGTLRLFDSRSELAYEIDLPDTGAGRDAAALLERGDIKGSSIGFRAIPKDVVWSVSDDRLPLRSVSAARLARVDLTVDPAYPDSTAEMAYRSLAEQTGLELRSLLEAADRGELASVIRTPNQIRIVSGIDPAAAAHAVVAALEEVRSDDQDETEDGRETTVYRRPAHWFV